jgi:FkbM family methyltransferase
VGLHPILLAKLGYRVSSYEPDPVHYAKLKENVELNGVGARVALNQAVVADRFGTLEFVRVVGNTTSSRVAGAKSSPYGNLEKFPVSTGALSQIMQEQDLIKMDIEGFEAEAIVSTTQADWEACDVMLEVGSPENTEKIWSHLGNLSLRCFSQQGGWKRAVSLEDMPTSYRGRSIFVARRDSMQW